LKISIFPHTFGDLVLQLAYLPDGSVAVQAVDASGSQIVNNQSAPCQFQDGGGHVELHTKVLAASIGIPTGTDQHAIVTAD